MTRLRTRCVLGCVLVALVAPVCCFPAWAGEPGGQQANGAVQATPEEDAADPHATLREAFEAAPDDLQRGIALQDAMLQAGEAREAKKLFAGYARTQPGSLVADYLLARLQTPSKKLKQMRAALDAGLGKQVGSKGELAALVEVVALEVAAGLGEQAAETAARIASLRGGAADWTYLGWIQERMLDHPADAAASYEAALARDDKHLGARSALAVLKATAGDKTGALTLAKAGVLSHPDESSAHLHLGLVQALCGNPSAARISYANALSRAGRDVDDLASIASAYMEIEEYELAAEALQRAMQISPNDGRVLTRAGLLALDTGKDKVARSLFQRAAKADPRDARIAFLQAVSEERLGLGSKAVASYRRALQLDPDRVEYLTALALALRNQGSMGSAISKFKEAAKADPENGGLQLQLGITYLKQRKYRPALSAFDKAAELDGGNPRPHFYRAIILGDHMGKPKDAKQALETYVQLGGKEPSAVTWLNQLREAYGK